MSGVLLAVLAAVAYGTSDFYAGVLSRRSHFALVGLVSQIAAAAATTVAAVAVGGTLSAQAFWWGAISGFGAILGTLSLYRGLARGAMNVVGPISAVGAAGIPVIFAILTGERPSLLAFGGILIALPAVWMVASSPDRTAGPRAGVTDGILAGVGFALLFIALNRAGHDSGLWPTSVSQVTGLLVLIGYLAIARPPRSNSLPWRAAAVGILGAAAIVLFVIASRTALLSVTAVITSSYPAITVLLAALLLGERASRLQIGGLALSAVSVVAFALA
ncbi:MAG: DMT family transporter [Antricoccus sp.]